MKSLVAGLVAAALIGLASAAGAQGIPAGSYRGTCTNIRLDGDTLKAVCTSRSGSHLLTELHHPERCGDIANNNGILQCLAGAPRAAEPPPAYGPPGYAPPAYGPGPAPGSGPHEERCERLRHRAHELRERLRYELPPAERREVEHRLVDTREDFRNERCGEWRD
jgi:hypothetical protein